MRKKTYNWWTEKEVDFVLQNGVAFDGTLKNEAIRQELKKLTGLERSVDSIKNKICRLRIERGDNKVTLDLSIDSYPIHKDLILLDQKFDKGGRGKYTLVCKKGHRIEKEPANWRAGCNICSGTFVGGIPKNDFRPAVVYLIYVKKFNAIKIGYATGNAEDAVVKRFERWELPYKYSIVAYDQSTRTEAAEHEQWLLDNTLKHKTFDSSQEFAGWTEFRNMEALNQILPEYETVLDIAFRI